MSRRLSSLIVLGAFLIPAWGNLPPVTQQTLTIEYHAQDVIINLGSEPHVAYYIFTNPIFGELKNLDGELIDALTGATFVERDQQNNGD